LVESGVLKASEYRFESDYGYQQKDSMKYRVVSVQDTPKSVPVYHIEQRVWGIWKSIPHTGGYFELHKAIAHCDIRNNKQHKIKTVVYPKK
jgi:hypothetical protein